MKINHAGIYAVLLAAVSLIHVPAWAADAAADANVRHVSGEITRVDVKLGTVALKSDMPQDTGAVTEYKINKNDTRVADPLDKKFLTIDDLQEGQYAVIDVVNGKEDMVVKKITAQPYVAPGLQQAFGELTAIDAAGTFTLEERPRADDMGERNLSYFIFEPNNIIIMQDPSTQPVQLVLKPRDLVKVVYAIKDGEKHAQSITAYIPKSTQTTVTTTTTTTR